MKRVLLGLLSLVIGGFLFFGQAGSAEAVVKVKGYYRSNGTYVQPYYRSNSDSYKFNNYSAKGNYNPYTGKKGYVRW